MSRNLSETHCARCGFHVKLSEKPRPIGVEDCGEYWYNKGQRGMIVANAECVLCGAKYLAWVDDRAAEKIGTHYGDFTLRAQASECELADAAEDGTDYFFDLSYRSTFDDEPGDEDLPPFDVEHPFAAKDVAVLRLTAQIAAALALATKSQPPEVFLKFEAILAPEKDAAERVAKPHRAVEVDIHIGADDMDVAVFRLEQISQVANQRGQIVGGASDSGTSIDVATRPDQTGEKYHGELKAYLEARREEEASEDEA